MSGVALIAGDVTTDICLMNPDTVSSTALGRIKTGWIVMGGPQDDNRVTDIVVHSKYGGPHGVEVTIATDYGPDQPTKARTLTQTLNASLNGRLDLSRQLGSMAARAVQVTLVETDAVGEGFQPVNMTLEIIKNPGKMAQSIRKDGRF